MTLSRHKVVEPLVDNLPVLDFKLVVSTEVLHTRRTE